MSHKKSETQNDERRSEAGSNTAPASGAAVAEGAPTAAVGDGRAAPQSEVEDLRQRNLRLMADMRNMQARLQREKEETVRFAEAGFARDLLVVIDDLERTQESIVLGAEADKLAEGVRIVYEHFLKVLRQRHVEPIESVGKPFDPTVHEALLQQPSDEYPAGVVSAELARGFRMHDRVLRPARVAVSSGPATGTSGSVDAHGTGH